MTEIKRRITVRREVVIGSYDGEEEYRVVNAVNTVTPKVNALLTETEVQKEIDRHTEVTIKGIAN